MIVYHHDNICSLLMLAFNFARPSLRLPHVNQSRNPLVWEEVRQLTPGHMDDTGTLQENMYMLYIKQLLSMWCATRILISVQYENTLASITSTLPTPKNQEKST